MGKICIAALATALLASCGDDHRGRADAGAVDTGGVDAGRDDAAAVDAGAVGEDAGPRGDDAGPPDAAAPDATVSDSGSPAPDAGSPDAGRPDPDAGTPDAGTPDAGMPDAGMPDAGRGVACGEAVCEPRGPECSWEGIDRILYDVTCITPDTDPRCAYPATRETCDHACEDGECVAAGCVDADGHERIDACGDAVDEDCDGSARACETPIHRGDAYEEVTLFAGLLLDRSRLDIWTLAADHPEHFLAPGARVHNMSGMEVSYSVNGMTTRSLAAGATTTVSAASWDRPGAVRFTCGGCATQTLEVGYYSPPEPHARFVGYYSPDDGATAYPATLEVQTIPLPTTGGEPHPKSLRHCLCWDACRAFVDLTLTLELPEGDFVMSHDYGLRFRPQVVWSAETRVLQVQFGSAPPGPGGGVTGPPERLEGTIHDSLDGSPSGDLVLHME